MKEGKQKWDETSLYFHVPKVVRLYGDFGYNGQDEISITDSTHVRETKELFTRLKSQQETYSTRLKFLGVLDQKFHHGKNGLPEKMKLLQTCFDAVCVLVAYDRKTGHALFEV